MLELARIDETRIHKWLPLLLVLQYLELFLRPQIFNGFRLGISPTLLLKPQHLTLLRLVVLRDQCLILQRSHPRKDTPPWITADLTLICVLFIVATLARGL